MNIEVDRSYRALFRQPSLGRVVVSMQLARTAASGLPIILVLYALTIYESPALAGALTFLGLFPGLVAAPVIGALLDRLGRIRLIRIDYAVTTVGASLLAALALGGRIPEVALVGITFVLGVTQMFSDSGLRSLFPRLAPAELWERVNAIDSTGYQIATIVGPPLAATLFVVAGPAPSLLIVAALFATALFVLIGAREPIAAAPEENVRLIDATVEGLRYVWSNQTLRAISLAVSPTSVCLGIAIILAPIILIDHLAAPEWLVGLTFTVAGVLGIVAAFLLGRSDTLGRERLLIIAAEVGTTIAAVILWPAPTSGLVVGAAWVFASAAIIGFSGGVWDIGVFTLRQRRTDPRMMGRAFAISMALNSSGFPIGAALGGWLATQSVELAVIVSVSFGVAGVVLGWLQLPRTDEGREAVPMTTEIP